MKTNLFFLAVLVSFVFTGAQASAQASGNFLSPLPSAIVFAGSEEDKSAFVEAVEIRFIPDAPAEVISALNEFQKNVAQSHWGNRVAKVYLVRKGNLAAHQPTIYDHFESDFSQYLMAVRGCGLVKMKSQDLFTEFFDSHVPQEWPHVASSLDQFFGLFVSYVVSDSIGHTAYQCRDVREHDEDGLEVDVGADDRWMVYQISSNPVLKGLEKGYTHALVVLEMIEE